MAQARAQVRALAHEGESLFLFLRTARLGSWLRGRRGAVEQGKGEFDLLQEMVRGVWDSDRTVHLVPLALFWRKGPRARRRFLNLFYGSATRPSDLAKVTSFLTTYRGLFVKVGEPVDPRACRRRSVRVPPSAAGPSRRPAPRRSGWSARSPPPRIRPFSRFSTPRSRP